MNLKRVFELFEIIKQRLPKTYPRPTSLAFFQTEESMLATTKVKKEKDETVYAVVDPNTETVSLPLEMKIEYKNKAGEEFNKTVPLSRVEDDLILEILLHECGHLLYGQKYGYNSKKYLDEKQCDKFAKRWLQKIKKEKLI